MKYSVVVPCGKLDGNINRCILGIIKQSIDPDEIFIICNNGVNIEEISNLLLDLEKYPNFKKINLIDGSNLRNANQARNFGLNITNSEWVAFLDSDDWWDEEWIKNASTKSSADFIYGSIRVHGESNSEVLHADDYKKYITPENYLLQYKPAQTSTYLIKTSFAKKILWDQHLKRHQDYDFFARAVKSSSSTEFIKDAFVNVDWSKPRRHKLHLDCLKVVKKWRSRVERKYYIRHIYNLFISSCKSRDMKALTPILLESLYLIFYKKYLN